MLHVNATYVALLSSFVSFNDGQPDVMHPFRNSNSVGGTSATNLWQHMDYPGGHSPVIFDYFSFPFEVWSYQAFR